MRVRYSAKAFQKGFPLLDLGHHTNTVTFSEKATTLAIKKNVETNIDMTGQHQIDFKAVDAGICEIDDVKLWEGQ